MNTSNKEWYERRVEAVEKTYDAYDALTEHGVEIPERGMDLQVLCPFHNEQRPSARYYGANSKGHFHCYACKVHENSIGLYARFKGIKFNEALVQLERRFHIKIPRRPEEAIQEPKDKGGPDYESGAWSDIPRVLGILENKLTRVRNKVSLVDYVKFCRVLDTIQWDLDHNGNVGTPQMTSILIKLRQKMDDAMAQELICD